jgi:hypothetical protein
MNCWCGHPKHEEVCRHCPEWQRKHEYETLRDLAAKIGG